MSVWVSVMSTSIFPSVPLMLVFKLSPRTACPLPCMPLLPGYDLADTLRPDLELACVTSESTYISVGVLSPFIHTFFPPVFIFSRLMASFLLDIEKEGFYRVQMFVLVQHRLIWSSLCLKGARCGHYWRSGEQGEYRNTAFKHRPFRYGTP